MAFLVSSFNSIEDFEILQHIAEEETMNPKDIADALDMHHYATYQKTKAIKQLDLTPELINQLDWKPLESDGKYSIDTVGESHRRKPGRKAAALYLLEPSVSKHEIADSVGLDPQTVYGMSQDGKRPHDMVENVDDEGFLLKENAHGEYRFLHSVKSVLQRTESSSNKENRRPPGPDFAEKLQDVSPGTPGHKTESDSEPPSGDDLESLINESQHINDLNESLPQTYFVSRYENKGDYLWLKDCAPMQAPSKSEPQSEYLLVADTNQTKNGIKCGEIVRELEEEMLNDLC
jgi:hypothetical protein